MSKGIDVVARSFGGPNQWDLRALSTVQAASLWAYARDGATQWDLVTSGPAIVASETASGGGVANGTTTPDVGGSAGVVRDVTTAAGTTTPDVGASTGVVHDVSTAAGTTSPDVGASTGFVANASTAAGTTLPDVGASTGVVHDVTTAAGTTTPDVGASVGIIRNVSTAAGTTSPDVGASTGVVHDVSTAAGTTLPDVGAATGFLLDVSTAAGTTLPDVGAATGFLFDVSTAAGTTLPDVGAATGFLFDVSTAAGTTLPDVGAATGFLFDVSTAAGTTWPDWGSAPGHIDHTGVVGVAWGTSLYEEGHAVGNTSSSMPAVGNTPYAQRVTQAHVRPLSWWAENEELPTEEEVRGLWGEGLYPANDVYDGYAESTHPLCYAPAAVIPIRNIRALGGRRTMPDARVAWMAQNKPKIVTAVVLVVLGVVLGKIL